MNLLCEFPYYHYYYYFPANPVLSGLHVPWVALSISLLIHDTIYSFRCSLIAGICPSPDHTQVRIVA